MIRCSPDNVHVVCEGLDHPECLALAPDGAFVAGGEAGQIYRIELGDSSPTPVVTAITGGVILGVCTDATGTVYACDCKRNEVLKIDRSGRISVLSNGTTTDRAINPNYGAFNRDGNFFYSASGAYFHPTGDGKLFSVTPEGETRCIHPGPLRFPNGIFVDWENDLLYVVLSTAPSILVFDIDGPLLKSLRPKQEFPLQPDTVPDGIALDARRNVYVSYWAPDQLALVKPDGHLEVLFWDPTAELLNRPTNLVLRPGAIYVANFGAWNISRIEWPVEPLEPVRPRL